MPTLLRKLKKTGFFIALVLLLQNAAAQTGEIKGSVRDREGKSVVSANLALKGTTYGAMTDGNGTYHFTNIPAGNYTIVFSNVGYKQFSKKINIKEEEVLQLDIEAETDVSQLQTMEVTGRKETSYKNDKSFSASKIEMAIKDIPQSISTVTRELPAYVVFNGGIYYQVKRLQLSVNLNNLADKKYISGGYNYERNFPGAPRNFLLNVGYTF